MKLHADHPKNMQHSVCPSPWTTLLINYDGGISFCCFHPAFANIRSCNQHSLEEVWNQDNYSGHIASYSAEDLGL